jgi:hypothetical protein
VVFKYDMIDEREGEREREILILVEQNQDRQTGRQTVTFVTSQANISCDPVVPVSVYTKTENGKMNMNGSGLSPSSYLRPYRTFA